MMEGFMDLIRKKQRQQAIFSTLPGLKLDEAARVDVAKSPLEKEINQHKERRIAERETGSDSENSRVSKSEDERLNRDGAKEAEEKVYECRLVSEVEPELERESGCLGTAELIVGQVQEDPASEVASREEVKKQESMSRGRRNVIRPHYTRRGVLDDPFESASFVYIPPGIFFMGSPEDEPGRNKDETLHEVTLTRGFSMQTTLVTRRQWKRVMGNNPSSCKSGDKDCPVDGVSWIDCQEFIKKLNATETYRYRLPTEAEWEYACRANSSGGFGHECVDLSEDGHCTGLDEIAWYEGNSKSRPHPVARKRANAWGLFDMHGNLCEWCQDWYGEYPLESQEDPAGAMAGFERISRGGCWVSIALNCRSACRFSWPPDWRSDFVGFRLVREDI